MGSQPITGSGAVARALACIRDGAPDTFEATAFAVFAHQFMNNEPYRRFCRRRGIESPDLGAWWEIPPVPVAAFRYAELTTAPPRRVFRTSGTTGGEGLRGAHHLPTLELYEASWSGPFRRYLLPDRRRIRMLSLIPAPEAAPDSSLAFMAGAALARYGTPESETVLGPAGLDRDRLEKHLSSTVEGGEPVLILGTAFALVELLDLLAASGVRHALPPGSRLMDTGGFKGRTRILDRDTLRGGYRDRLGIPGTHVVAEYGMTELCSQFYEPHLGPALRGDPVPGPRFVGPPWVRTRILDPDRLVPVEAGRPGLLAHWDLANAATVMAVLTEDLGVEVEDGFRLVGRATGAELRGCSLATEELLHG